MNYGDVYSMYVYCDLLEHVIVGDTKAPLLRVIDLSMRKHRNVHHVMNPILYVPLQIKNLSLIHI